MTVIPNEKQVILLARTRAEGVYHANRSFAEGAQRNRWLDGRVRVVTDVLDLRGVRKSGDLVVMMVGQFENPGTKESRAIIEYLDDHGIAYEQGPIE